MRYLFFLFLILLSNICFATSKEDVNRYDYYHFSIDLPSLEYYYSSFRSNPIILYPERYINDLGHEFPIEFFISGTYWKGGAWGSKNGFNQYYGNIYYSHNYCPIDRSYTIPEPSSLVVFGLFFLLFRKKLIEK